MGNDAGLYGTPDDDSAAAPLRLRLLGVVATIVALAVLALTVAYWGWRWLGPAPASLPIAAPDAEYGQRIVDAHLFGAVTAQATSGSPAAAPSLGDVRLLGIVAARDGKGYALFRSPSRGPQLVAAGQEVVSGVKLEAIRPNGVTLVEGGVRRDVPLRAAPASGERTPPRVATASSAAAAPCAAPAGFSGPVVRLNAELLSGMMNSTDAWKALVEPGAGALVVRDQSGFASNLGLRNGDRVESANGIALTIPADIPALVLAPLTRSQPVWLAGSRGGKVQHWLYLNAGACPA